MTIMQHVAAAEAIIAELTYRSYREQRRLSPYVAPERWGAIYPDWQELEARYQEETR